MPLIFSALSLMLLTLAAYAAPVDTVRIGQSTLEHIHFDSPEACDEAVQTALQQAKFAHDKTGFYDQGPAVFSKSQDGKHKAVSKCLLNYDLLATTVIGDDARANLRYAIQINQNTKQALEAKAAALAASAAKNTPQIAAAQGWQVQTGAFSSSTLAEAQFHQLSEAGLQPAIIQRDGLWLLRVPASPIGLEEAGKLETQLKLLKFSAVLKPAP